MNANGAGRSGLIVYLIKTVHDGTNDFFIFADNS